MSKTTLGRAPFFAKMLDPGLGLQPAHKDSKGNYFIDRSPKPFEVILKFLRTGKVYSCEGVSEEELRDEADFYGIEMFEDHIEEPSDEEEEEACKEVILIGHDSGPNPKMELYKFRIDISGDYKLYKGVYAVEYGYGLGLSDEWAEISHHCLQLYNSMGQQQEPRICNNMPDGSILAAFFLHEKLLPGRRTVLFYTFKDEDSDLVDMLPLETRIRYEKEILQDWELKWNGATHVNHPRSAPMPVEQDSPLKLYKYRLERVSDWEPDGTDTDYTLYYIMGRVEPE